MPDKNEEFPKDPKRRCPKCGVPGVMYVDEGLNALDRKQNRVICEDCGRAQAMADMPPTKR